MKPRPRCLFTLLALLPCGCGSPLIYTYDEAESRQKALDRAILIFYKNPEDPACGQMQDRLQHGQLAALVNNKIRCVLVSEFEPNRRYVAQYGVTHPPALIVIHPDSTYHSIEGLLSVEQIKSFLASATPPGARPNLSPQIPRAIDYHWENDVERALARARQRNRELFVVYKSWTSAESTELLARLMNRPELAAHFVERVNCILDDSFAENRSFVARYGIDRVPAMLMIHRDGTYHARAGPASPEEIAHFVITARSPGRIPGYHGRGDPPASSP